MSKKNISITLLTIAFFMIVGLFSFAEEYEATVTTDSGSYTVPVEVEYGEVTFVHWPNGGDMHVYGGELDDDGYAYGTNSRGDSIEIEVDDYSEEAYE